MSAPIRKNFASWPEPLVFDRQKHLALRPTMPPRKDYAEGRDMQKPLPVPVEERLRPEGNVKLF